MGMVKRVGAIIVVALIVIYLGSRLMSDPSGAATGVRDVFDAVGRAVDAIITFVTTLGG